MRKVTDSRFRFGTSSDVSLVSQALAFGDRRLFPIVEACVTDDKIKYLGGMGIGSKEAVPEFTRLLHTLTTIKWSYFIRVS